MKKLLILALSFLFIATSVAYAAEEVPIDFSYDTVSLDVEVWGCLGSEYKNKTVTLLVVKGVWETDYTSITGAISGETIGSLNWFDITTTDAGGNYEFSYTMAGESGSMYSILVTVDGSDTVLNKNFKFFDDSEPGSLKNRYKTAKEDEDYEEITDIIDGRKDYLQLDMTDYNLIEDETSIDGISKGLLKCDIDLSSNDTFITGFKSAFVETSKVWVLNEEEENFENLLKTVLGDSAIVADEYFESFDDDVRQKILSEMQDIDFEIFDDLLAEYNRQVFTTVANDAVLWTEMEAMLIAAQDELDLDFSDYDDLSNKAAAIKKMLKKSYDELEDIKEAFDYAVSARKSEEKNESKKGSSSGGGSGSVCSLNVGLPISSYESENETTGSASSAVLNDISDAAWAEEAITSLYKKGVISGDENNNFLPNKNVTRAEFVKMLVESLGIELVYNKDGLQDVNPASWYMPYVYAAVENGIANGTGEGMFSPEATITRQDAAVMLYRAVKTKGIEFQLKNIAFDDNGNIANYAVEAVNAFASEQLINGMGDNCFGPTYTATKAQAAKMIFEVFEAKNLWEVK